MCKRFVIFKMIGSRTTLVVQEPTVKKVRLVILGWIDHDHARILPTYFYDSTIIQTRGADLALEDDVAIDDDAVDRSRYGHGELTLRRDGHVERSIGGVDLDHAERSIVIVLRGKVIYRRSKYGNSDKKCKCSDCVKEILHIRVMSLFVDWK